MPITRARSTNGSTSPQFFKSLFGTISQLFQAKKPRRRRASRQTAASAEVLELRTMLTAPALVAPAAATVTVGANTFTGANSISLTDTAGGTEQLSLVAQHGTLSFASTTGLTVSGNGTGTVLVSGNVANINTALAGLTYTTGAGFTGSDTLGMYVLNSSTNLSDNAAISLTSANLPTISAPTSVSVAQNGTLNLNAGNLISISDAGGGTEQLTLGVQHGTLSLGSTTGLTVTGNGTGSVVLTGSLANVNTALASLSYTPTVGFSGSDTLSISNLNTTTNLTANGQIGITVGAGSTAPTLTTPTSVTVAGGIASFTGTNSISISDTAGGTEQLSMVVQNGKLNVTMTSGVTVSGSGTGTLLISGSTSAVNAAIATLAYTANTGFTGTDTLGIYVLNSSSNLSDSAAITLSPTASGNAPVVTAPVSVSVAPNGSLAFTAGNLISVADAGGTTEQTTLSVGHGTLTLGTTTGLTVTGNGTGTVVLTGSLSNLNTSLATLVYTPAGSFSGSDTLNISNLNTTTNLTGTGVVGITVGIGSTAPTFTVPTSVSISGGTAAFTGANAISISDSTSGTEQLSMTVQHGTISLASTAGLTVSGNGTGTLLVSGSLAAINTALAGLTYNTGAGFNGTDTLAMYVLNSTNNLSGDAAVSLSAGATPVITAPATASVAQNGSLAFTSANAISVADSGGTTEQLTLSVQHGTLSLGSTTGLTVTGNGTASVVLTGSLSDLNTALASLSYSPTASYTGADTLSLSNLNTTTNLTGTASVSLTVGTVSSPTFTAPPVVTVVNGSAAFTGVNAISLADSSGGTEQLSLAVQNGHLTFGSTTGLTVSGNGGSTVLLSGSVANINAALATLSYSTGAGFTGTDYLGIYVLNSSTNQSGSVGVQIVSTSLPTITVPSVVSVAQNGTLAFNSGNLITVSDTPGSTEQLTLGVQHGTLSLGSTTGLTVTGNGTASVVLTGSLADVNAAMATLTYTPTVSYTGSDTLSLSNLNTTTNLTGTASVPINVGVGATAPILTAPVSLNAFAQTPATFTGSNAISITDTAGGTEQLSLVAQNGKLNLTLTSGVTASGNGTGTLLISGSAAAVNAVLAGLTYTANVGFTGTDTLGMYVLNSSTNLSDNAAVAISVS